MSDNSKFARLVAKLDALTGQDVLKWETSSDDPTSNADRLVGQVYKTEVEDQDFRLYEYSTRVPGEYNELEWTDQVCLEFVDSRGKVQFTVSSISGLWQLLKTVRLKTHGIDARIDQILKL